MPELSLSGFGLRFHHLGLAVADPEAAEMFLGGLGYLAGAKVFDPRQNVNLAMLHHATMPDVEVIWPGAGASPIDKMIRRGHMIYHICYQTADATVSIEAIHRAGLNVAAVSAAVPALLFGGIPVSFHTIDGFGMIELLHGNQA